MQTAEDMHEDLLAMKKMFKLGYGLIEVIPADIRKSTQYSPFWGRFNDRGVDLKALGLMTEKFAIGEVRRFNDPIPILVRPEWLDGLDQLEQTGTEEALSKLKTVVKWTNEVRGKRVDYLNGRHRSLASAAAKKIVTTQLAVVRKKMEKESQAKMSMDERVQLAIQEKNLENILETLGTWVGVFYKQGEYECIIS